MTLLLVTLTVCETVNPSGPELIPFLNNGVKMLQNMIFYKISLRACLGVRPGAADKALLSITTCSQPKNNIPSPYDMDPPGTPLMLINCGDQKC